MKSKEKAKELVDRYYDLQYNIVEIVPDNIHQIVKQCALICVDEILLEHIWADPAEQSYYYMGCRKYWQEVKQEIEKLCEI